jgi:hypothetical protein
MRIVFTYLPIRLKDITEIYLKYTIKNLNDQSIKPIIYSDQDYFKNTDLKYELINFNIPEKYKKNTLWSYPKLKVLSTISYPFVHLDNDIIVNDINKLQSKLIGDKLNLGYKHQLTEEQIKYFIEIYKFYSEIPLDFSELNNTCIIGTNDFQNINKSYIEVINVIENNYDFFSNRYNNIPPITLNQQYVNRYFKDINYIFNENPSFDNLEINGVCHMSDKNMVSKFIENKTLI